MYAYHPTSAPIGACGPFLNYDRPIDQRPCCREVSLPIIEHSD